MAAVMIFNQGSRVPIQTGAIYYLVERNGVWKLRNYAGAEYTARGRFNFIRLSGRLLISKRGEHIHISGGKPVEYAGVVCFGYNRMNRGRITRWSNASGHYMPSPLLAPQAGLPMALFEPIQTA